MEMGNTMAELFVEKLGKEIAEKALDEYEYKGKTIREWADLLINGDAVEVVRCKDCIRRYDTDECPMCYLFEGQYYEYTNGNGYCDRGERKDGVDDADD